MTDKTLEAVRTKWEKIFYDACPGVYGVAEALDEVIAAHDSDLKKHIKVLVQAMNKQLFEGNLIEKGMRSGVMTTNDFIAWNLCRDAVKQALASLPEEVRGL